MTTCCPSNDSLLYSADATSRLRLHSAPRPLAAAEKEKKIIVMRSRGSENILSFHHLLPQASEFRETLRLPFSDQKGRNISCGECRGLLHFDTLDGSIILCNPTTAQFSFFPRPRKESRRDVICYEASGFGFDHTSNDYKIVRIFWHSYFDDEEKRRTYGYRRTVAQVYSLKSDCWKEIDCPPEAQVGRLHYKSCAYVCGKYYWISGRNARILSFDFATETLETSPLPKSDIHTHGLYQFVELDDKLGAILRERPEASRTSTRVEVWVLEEDGSWVRRYHAAIDDVVRTLGLKHGLLFLEGKSSSEKSSQLVVCDLATEKLEWLEVYDNLETMEIFSYVENTYTLPDAKPMDGTYPNPGEEEEFEDTSDEETDDDIQEIEDDASH